MPEGARRVKVQQPHHPLRLGVYSGAHVAAQLHLRHTACGVYQCVDQYTAIGPAALSAAGYTFFLLRKSNIALTPP